MVYVAKPIETLGAICRDTLLGPSMAKREAEWPRRRRARKPPS